MTDWREIAKEFEHHPITDGRSGHVQRMAEEILRLRRIIAKELTEDDDLGAEFIYVNILKEEIAHLVQHIKGLPE
jgi:hypothetical protein